MILKAGDGAPDFELAWLTGKDEVDHAKGVPKLQSLKNLLERGPALLVFVKEDCPTCEYTLPLVDRIYQNYPGSKASIVVIAQEGVFAALKMVQDWGIHMPVLLDQDPFVVGEDYGLVFVPTFFSVGQDGKIVRSFESFAREELKAINEEIARFSGVTPIPFFTVEEGVPAFRPG
ncbi:MAG: TlpA disulfide reductase family protein [Acidobacteria bacterium]|nr:TlpA disulfide reductase family protein [Acidobacteriota bacterium]MCZ6768943.1 TlpA disulfide reductase family protein [Acidobacteriota bacterium]MCZ6877603.1 TlpA disulfide reductase family protein [Acidobacteriota bacterium]